ncbi:MAG TPA: CaiB/BaiF CoA-transferase family protein, partial [Saprospiraceae bacterium]|nr:CaiB/BaiF CoA-transferase family protein [Saprospiraceae bacterium]
MNLEFKNMDRPFEGLKVLDLSAILAGPLVGSFFAELGADVIKIENKLTKGDATRQWKLTTEDPEATVSAYYCAANYGKDVQLLDLSDEKKRQRIDQLLAESDVVISNFQKKTAEKLKLNPEYICTKFPNLIFAQLSAYTYDDPRPGYDLVMQGETGWISMNGIDGQHMAKLPVAIIDIIAAHQMKEAVLIALLKKMKDGKGSVVHVSLYKSAISALANQASNYLMAGHIPKPLGTLHPNIAPYGDVFSTSDGQKLILAVGSDAQFKKLWFSLTSDEDFYHKFALNSQRISVRSLLQETLQQLIG